MSDGKVRPGVTENETDFGKVPAAALAAASHTGIEARHTGIEARHAVGPFTLANLDRTAQPRRCTSTPK